MSSSRPIKRLLVANRGEIASRILSSARELGLETFAVYTSDDVSHTHNAAHAIKLRSASSYLNISELVQLSKDQKVDAVHPGYGFLSESPEFARRMWDEAGVLVIGPGWEILERTGDKLKARLLAEQCTVPVLPALQTPTNNIPNLRSFATQAGYPIMVKAVDGGGGRGIRLIQSDDALESSAKRAIEESPTRQVFAEKAAVNGFRHIEVQIIGDGKGNVRHLWERECSIQRRYQKVVEIAPSSIEDRAFVAKIIEAALRMAEKINYRSLGTFEFLANPTTREFYFLEVNPRLQVEHTITESIALVDIVRIQILLAQGRSLPSAGLADIQRDPQTAPPLHSCQLRITAENLQSDWSLSIGKIQSFHLPSGNGIRVDTNLINGHPSVVSADFDSLLAKLIITAPTWLEVVAKARRALEDTNIEGVKTNVDVLRGIVAHPDFASGRCDTRWLEANQQDLLRTGEAMSASRPKSLIQSSSTVASTTALSASSSTLFRKGDAWSISLTPSGSKDSAMAHYLQLTRVQRNEFPNALTGDILYTAGPNSTPAPYTMTLTATSATSGSTTAQHRRGDPGNKDHVVIPFPGKLIEVLIDEGDVLNAGDVVCVVQQMKMELEVRTPRPGKVSWVLEAEEGEEIAEGTLAAELVEVEGRVEAKL